MKIKIVPLVIKATIYGGWSVNVNPTAASKNIARVGLRWMETAIDLPLCRSPATREFTPPWRYAVTRKISLLVPLFNSSRYLDQLKHDIDHQTRPFDEVVMHDDGSTDDTIEKAAGLGFRVIRGGPRNGSLTLETDCLRPHHPASCISTITTIRFTPNSSSAC